MKKQIFSYLSMAAITFSVAVVTVSCGGGGGANQQQQSATTETKTEQTAPAKSGSLERKDVNINNWQAVIKAQREGVEVPLPDGWTVTKAEPGIHYDVVVNFNIGGSTTAEQFGQMLMDATKAVAKNGNHKIEVTEKGTEEGAAIEKISEAAAMQGASAYSWCYTVKYVYQAHYYVSDDKKTASISF